MLSVDKQHLPRRKYFPVKQVADIIPHNGNGKLHKCCHHKIFGIQPPVVHQGKLEISQDIDEQNRKNLREKQVHGFQISDLQSAIGAGEKEQQRKIYGKHTDMPVSRIFQTSGKFTDGRIVILEPYVGINRRLQQQTYIGKPKHYYSF